MADHLRMKDIKDFGTIPPRCLLRKSPFGPVALLWSIRKDRPEILRIFISSPEVPAARKVASLSPDPVFSSCAEMDAVAGRIEAFLNGEKVRFSLDRVAWDACSPFQRKVLLAEYGIPRGQVSTYRRIADFLGIPRGARAVGGALADNPFPILIPCHRVVRSDGTPGGYQGGGGMKKILLEMEGFRFDGRGRLKKPEYFVFAED